MRRLRNVLLALLLVLGLGWAGLVLLERSGFLERRVRAAIQEFVGGDVAVGDVDLEWSKLTLSVNDVSLGEAASGPRLLSIPRFDVHAPFHFTSDGKAIPEALTVTRPALTLVERPDGSFSPLHLVRSVGKFEFAPAVSIVDGTLTLQGEGPLQSLLGRLLRDDLVRHLSDVDLSTYPLPAPATDLLAFSGQLDVPIGLPMRLSGSLDRGNRLRAEASIEDVDLGREDLRAALRPEWREWLDQHVRAGRFGLELEFGAGVGASGIHARAHAREFRIEHPAVSIPLVGVSGEAEFDGTQLRVLNVRARDGDANLTADLIVDDVSTGALRATVRGEGLAFESGLVASLTDPDVRRIIADYGPQGSFDLFVDLTRKSGGELRTAWRAVPRADASASFIGHLRKNGRFVGFPYRLHGLTGEISGNGGHVDIQRITGRHNGGDFAVVEGFVDTQPEGTAFEINVRATQAPFDKALRDGLDVVKPGVGSLVDSFHPEGKVDLFVSVAASHTQIGATVRGDVRTRGSKMRYDVFPYALHDVTGHVAFDDDVYTVHGLEGRHGNGTVKVTGTITQVGASDVALDLKIAARSVEVDDDLRAAVAAIAPEAADAFQWLQPAGPFDLDLELKKAAGEKGRFKALLTPKGVRIIPTWLPVPLEGVVGKAEFGTLHDDPKDDRFWLELDPLRASTGEGTLVCRARFQDGKEPWIELTGDDVLVDAEFRDRIREGAAAAEGERARIASLIDHLAPDGRISFRYGRDGTVRERLSLRLNGVSGQLAAGSGVQLHDLRGVAVADLLARSVELTDIEGTVGDSNAPFSIRTARFDVRGANVDVDASDVEVRALELDERVMPFFGASFAKVAAVTKPRGRVDLALNSIRFAAPLEAGVEAPAAQFDGEVSFANCALTGALRVNDMSGRLLLQQRVGDDGARLLGSIQDLGFELAGFRLAHLAAEVASQGGGLEVRGLAGELAGGAFPAAGNWLRIGGDDASTFDGRLELHDADLRELLLLRGGTAEGIEGRVSMHVEFGGDTASRSGIHGGGRIDVKSGRLWDLPIFATLYRVSLGRVFGETGKPVFESGHVEFELRRGDVVLNEVKFAGPLLSVEGRGVAGPTGIDVLVAPKVVEAELPIVSPVLDFLKRRVISYRIFGPWARPRVAYWNDAVDIFSTDEDVTQMARLPPRRLRDWNERF
jgi:hypothetical protein